MSVVLGLDLSLTGSGVATIDRDGTPHVRTEKSDAAGGAALPRWQRLTNLARRVTDPAQAGTTEHIGAPALVVVEGPSYGSSAQKSASIHDRAGLWWVVVGALLDQGVPVAVCAPTVRAKWATGRGNAGKSEVSVGVARFWPDVNARCDDEWDALALASMAAQHLGWIETLAKHRDALGRVEWPMAVAR